VFDSQEWYDFSLLSTLQTGSGAQPPSHPMGTGGEGNFPQGLKLQGREADHSPPSTVGDKNGGAIPALLHTFSWRGA
jgi:hypothetical protein